MNSSLKKKQTHLPIDTIDFIDADIRLLAISLLYVFHECLIRLNKLNYIQVLKKITSSLQYGEHNPLKTGFTIRNI